MISIYKDMSDLDPTRIVEVVDSLEKMFDEDHSGSVGLYELHILDKHFRLCLFIYVYKIIYE
mgnify:CR=1 FL=1